MGDRQGHEEARARACLMTGLRLTARGEWAAALGFLVVVVAALGLAARLAGGAW